MLILGCGLGSSVQILAKKYKCKANYTLVELDSQILEWVSSLLEQMNIKPVQGYNEDAYAFLRDKEQQHDLICIDVFIDLTVPKQFLTKEFFILMKSRLKKDGIWIMNYMTPPAVDPLELKNNIAQVFPDFKYIQNRENFIFYAENKDK